MKELILGGIRSGKSRIAEQLAENSGFSVTYIATATACDQEMQSRITTHQLRRPKEWRLIEEPIRLTHVLRENASADSCLLIDCLTLWLSNVLEQCSDQENSHLKDELLDALVSLPGRIIFVSSETGLGIIPDNSLARKFCDQIGELHQAIAKQCDRVILCVAGIPQIIKGEPL